MIKSWNAILLAVMLISCLHCQVLSSKYSSLVLAPAQDDRIKTYSIYSANRTSIDFIDNEQRLIRSILADYDKTVRPGVIHQDGTKEPLIIDMQLALRRIMGSDDRIETMTLCMFVLEEWYEPRLVWDPEDFGNLTYVTLPVEDIWTPRAYWPNLFLMNPDDKREQFNTIVNLTRDQYGQWIPRVTLLTYALLQERCEYDMTYFPFDHQSCEMCLANAQYDYGQLIYEARISQLATFIKGGEWDLVNMTVIQPPQIDSITSAACFAINVQRRSIYYVVNLFIPTIIIGVLNTIGLFAAVDEEHKELEFSTLGQTTLLALGVMLLTVADQTPKGAERISLLGLFYLAMITQTFLAALTAVYLKKHTKRKMKNETALSRAKGRNAETPRRGTTSCVAWLCMIIHLILIGSITGVALGVGYVQKLKRQA